MTPSQDDRRTVNRWRGLRDHVLDELTELDRRALAAGRCRFLAERAANVKSRERCKALRAELGIDHMEKLR